jgi:hypothetical protein
MADEKALAIIYNRHKRIFESYKRVVVSNFVEVIFRVKSAILASEKD